MKKIANNIVRTVFMLISIFLGITSIFFTCAIYKNEKTTYQLDNWILNIICIIAVVGLVTFIKRKNIKIEEKTKKVIIYISTILWIILAFGWIFSTALAPRADQKYIYKAALGISEHDLSAFTAQKGYVNSNPQQEGMVLFEYLISLVTRKYMGIIVQVLNVFALLISFYAIYKITDIMFKNKDLSIITYICLLVFLPIFFYITFMYGNIFGLACSMVAVLFEIKYFEKSKWYYILISGIGISLAIIFKSNYLVTLIAMIIMFILHSLEYKKVRNIIAILSILLIYICANMATKFCIKQLTGANIEEGIPMITYVAMGMQEGEMAPGWYNGYNREVYKKNNYNYEETSKEAKEDIKERLSFFIQNPNYTIEFYAKKILSQWNNPTFQGFWVNKSRRAKVQKPSYVKSILGTGKVNKVLTEYMDIIQTLILFGATVYIILDYKKAKGNKLFLIIIFIGGFLFHLIWEAKCQYTITYFILLIPYCVKGYDLLTNAIINYNRCKTKYLLPDSVNCNKQKRKE